MALWEWICGGVLGIGLTYLAINPATKNGGVDSADIKFNSVTANEIVVEQYGGNTLLKADPRNPSHFINEDEYREALVEMGERALYGSRQGCQTPSRVEFELKIRER